MKRLFLTLLGAHLVACAGTQTGNPPLRPILDDDLIIVEETAEGLTITGEPGAVFPGGILIQSTNLVDGVPDAQPVLGNGAFELRVPFGTYRLQALNGRLRSSILDASVGAGIQSDQGVCRPRTRTNFVRIEGARDEVSEVTVEVFGACDALPTLEFLRGDQGLSASGMAFDGGVRFTLSFDGRAGEVEDTAVVRASGDPLFITVVAESCGEDCAP
ncbi:MAG: hypothetical protein AAF411_23270 [Myxococcota bacterium]